MSDTTRSEQACPACGQHTLAIDEPPHIDVMGVQAYSDMIGMGDFQQRAVLGIICLACGTRWRDRAAFDRNEPEAPLALDEAPATDAWADIDDGDEGESAEEESDEDAGPAR